MKRTGRFNHLSPKLSTVPTPRWLRARRICRLHGAMPRMMRGFTLIELLIAITILAVIAVLCWRGLDQIIRAREVISRDMDDERVVVQLFSQLGSDLQRAATDDEAGAAAIMPGSGELRIVRRLRQPGQAPRLEVVRYRLVDDRIVRDASPPLAQVGQLRAALSSEGPNWSSLTFMRGVKQFNVRAWVSGPDGRGGPGFTARPIDIEVARERALRQMGNPLQGSTPLQTSVSGVEMTLSVKGQARPFTRVYLVGE